MSCVAFAYAVEPSLSAFSATAALIGAATFAFTSDIAARSGSSSPASSFSSSRLNLRYSSAMRLLLCSVLDQWHRQRLDPYCRRQRLEDTHLRPLGQWFAVLALELFLCELVLLPLLLFLAPYACP